MLNIKLYLNWKQKCWTLGGNPAFFINYRFSICSVISFITSYLPSACLLTKAKSLSDSFLKSCFSSGLAGPTNSNFL